MKLQRPVLVPAGACIIAQFTACAVALAQPDVPVPRPKPDRLLVQPPPPAVAFSNEEDATPAHADRCKAALDAAGAAYNWVGVASEGSCKVANAVELLSVDRGGGLIRFRQQPVMGCDFAALLTRWTGEVAGPVVAAHTGAKLAALDTGPGIVCRVRVGAAGSKISEHAKGNAIDVTAFRLSAQRVIRVGAGLGGSEGTALKALRTSACGYFTTVLGPGSNPAHNHHFHFDYKKRGKSYNYRICE